MIKVYLNRKVSNTQITIGNQYESGVNAIDFDLSELKQKWPNGNIYLLVSRKKHTWPYSIDDGEFKIEYVLTWKRGFYQMNVVVTDEKITDQLESSNTIFVSDTINAYVNENQINAKALNEQELPRELQIVYDDLITLKKNIEKDLADGKYIGPQGPRGEKGEPGEKGDPGDVTEEYRNLASQIAQNASNAQTSATNAKTSESNTQKILEDTKAFANQTKSELNQIKTDMSELKDEASTSATNAKASEDKAKEYADKLQASTDDISQLKEDLVSNTKEDAKTKRSLSALWDLNNGISYRFETDSEKAYQKKVPSGAKLGSVNKVGGKTIVMNQLFKETNFENKGISITYTDGTVTINGTANDNFINFSNLSEKLNIASKFYIKMTVVKNEDGLMLSYGWLNRNVDMPSITRGSSSVIYNQIADELKKGTYTGITKFDSGSIFNDVKIKIMICNLTQMFGFGNEPSTPQEFEAMFPNDYYPYNDGELMSMSVNDIDVIGKNIFECENFSCSGFKLGNILDLSNSYGTSINSTAPSNKVTVTQSKVGQEDNVTSYLNGYFCIAFKPFSLSKAYVFSFDVNPSNKLISNARITILLNGNDSINGEYVQNLQIGKKSKLCFNLKTKDEELRYIEIRNSGISGIFENFQIEEGSINTSYSPYTKKSYPIPQVIQSLEGYGWSAGQAYNYVDFENKKYYKCVDKIDLGTFEEIYSYSGVTPEEGRYVYAINISSINAKLNSTAICELFDSISFDEIINKDGMYLNTAYNQLLVSTNKCETLTELKSYINGKYLHYELAEPIITDISDMIGDTFQEPFEVESGGSLTFKNTNGDGYQIAVPSDIQYTVALSEVNA